MKKRHWAIVTCFILLAAFSIYFRGENIWGEASVGAQTVSPSSNGTAKGGTANGVSGALQKESAKKAERAAVEIPFEKQQLIGVKKVDVETKPLQKTIRTVGRIEYDERKLVTVNLKVEGWIERLYGDFTGKYVKKGEPLAEIYSPEILSTQLQYINLLKWKGKGGSRSQPNLEFSWGDRYNTTERMVTYDYEALLQVAQQKLKFWDLTDEQIQKIQMSGEPIRTFTLYSPTDGYVLQKPAIQGKRVEPGEKLFDIVDLSTIWVISDIYVYELPLIKVGQAAKIILSHFPGKEFSSKVEYIYPTLSGETRTAKVRSIVPNRDGQLKPQMFTNVELKIDLGKRLVIPEDAIIDTGTRQVVYVDRGEGYFEPRQVTLGLRADGWVEVIKGLKAGEKVNGSANFLIDSEIKLKGVLEE